MDVWHPMMLEAADDIERQRKVISATIEDLEYLEYKQIEAAAEIENLRARTILIPETVGKIVNEYPALRAENEKLKQFHIDVAFELRGAKDEIRLLRAAMHDIYEVYAGSEGFIPQTCPEAYLQERVKEMADIAAKHKRAAAIRDE